MHLVTGGSGFVGSCIVRLLRERGEKVRVLDLWRADSIGPDVEFVQADINDAAAVAWAMRDVRYVHHNVALVPLAKAGDRFWAVNVEGTRVALEAARREGVAMFANMSSSAVFGLPGQMPITSQTRRVPIEAYGEAKKAAEDLALAAGAEGLPVSVIRPRTVIGPGRLGIFQILFEWIRDGRSVYTIGDGETPCQFIHVEDIAEVSIRTCLLGKHGEYNVGTDRFENLRTELLALCAHAGTGAGVRRLPKTLTISLLKALDTMRLSPLGPYHYLTFHRPIWFDSSGTYTALDWTPHYSTHEMLTGAYDWFVANFDAEKISDSASTHKRPVRQRILRLLKAVS
jgi:nucleoside-diphosphate-sugar epimerase